MLEWDDKIAEGAENWAKRMAVMGRVQHAPANERNSMGENLFFLAKASDDVTSCVDAVNEW